MRRVYLAVLLLYFLLVPIPVLVVLLVLPLPSASPTLYTVPYHVIRYHHAITNSTSKLRAEKKEEKENRGAFDYAGTVRGSVGCAEKEK